jgi:CHRD domain
MTKVPGLFIGAFALMFATAPNLSAQTLAATLNGGEETPILNTGAVGTVQVNVDVPNQELQVTLRVFNAPTPTSAGHIHIGPAGIAGPVVINFPEALNGRTGDFAMTFRVGPAQFVARPAIGINTMEDALQAILNGNSYVNIHTQQFPAGEIRGQLSLVK